jgi:hypothetical protein
VGDRQEVEAAKGGESGEGGEGQAPQSGRAEVGTSIAVSARHNRPARDAAHEGRGGYSGKGKGVVIRWASGVEKSETIAKGRFYKWIPKPPEPPPDPAQLAAEREAAKARQERADRERAEAKAKWEQQERERAEREFKAKAEEKRRQEWRDRWFKQPWEEDDWGQFNATMEGFRIQIYEDAPNLWRGSVSRGEWGDSTESYRMPIDAQIAAIDMLLDRVEAAQ